MHGLIFNCSILLSLALVFFLFTENVTHLSKASRLRREISSGFLLAGIGLLVMATPLDFGNGVVFDTRSILIGLAAAFFGWLPATMAALACAVYRIHEGGGGTVPGLLVILTSFLLGLAWRRWRGRSLDKASFGELYGLGLFIHLCMVTVLSALLPESRAAFLQQIAPFALVVYPLIFAILGLLMRHRYRLETERAKLEKSRESYRSLFANNHLPMFLIDPAEGSIVDANPAAESFYGWSRETLQQMRVTDLNVLDAAEVRRLVQEARQAERHEFELQHRLRDGSIRDILVRSGPVQYDGRELLYSIIADQTEAKRHLIALRESEARAKEFVRAVEQCHVSIVFTDPEGRIEYANPYFCELTGYTNEELIGQKPSILKSGRQPQSFYQALWQTIQSGKVWEGELCNLRKDGSLFWEYAVIAPVTNKAGTIVKYVGVKHNITAQKEHEKAMETALGEARAGSEARAAFLSVISHELSTPLNHILGPCEMVAQEMPAGESKKLLENAIEAAHHLTGLVQRIIRFSELGSLTASELRILDDPDLWLELALQRHREIAAERGFSIVHSVSENFPETFGVDETALNEILSALLDNALEYASPGPIRVELSMKEGKARLAVIDPGPALSEAEKALLFKPFQQVDMSSRREHPGIGLGLCLCRRYAKRCGGSIKVKTDPGGGNRFVFIFPITTKP